VVVVEHRLRRLQAAGEVEHRHPLHLVQEGVALVD
jgi:hypothetical protein